MSRQLVLCHSNLKATGALSQPKLQCNALKATFLNYWDENSSMKEVNVAYKWELDSTKHSCFIGELFYHWYNVIINLKKEREGPVLLLRWQAWVNLYSFCHTYLQGGAGRRRPKCDQEKGSQSYPTDGEVTTRHTKESAPANSQIIATKKQEGGAHRTPCLAR